MLLIFVSLLTNLHIVFQIREAYNLIFQRFPSQRVGFYRQNLRVFFLILGISLNLRRNDWTNLGLGSPGGAVFSQLLKLLIEEAKKKEVEV